MASFMATSLGWGVAKADALDDELRFLAAERKVTVVTASKQEERVEKTVSTTWLMDQAEMQKIGARTLLDVLRRVPGISVTQSALGIRQIEVRGIRTEFSEKVLFMLNGMPLDQNITNAGSTWVYDDLPVDTIQRVEVLRGPASALYGANAFLAVVNIITQSSKDFEGVVASAGGGSFDTQRYRGSVNQNIGENGNAVVHFNYANTAGIAAPVPEDALSAAGQPSLAPGKSQLNEARYDLEWQLAYEGFKLDGRFINKQMGAFIGPNYNLSDNTRQNYQNYFLRLSRSFDIVDDFSLTARAFHDYFNFDNLLQVAPPAGPPPQFFQAAATNTRTGAELQGNYIINSSSNLISGLTYSKESQFGVSQKAGNYPKDLQFAPPFSESVSRDIWGIYAQNIWDLFGDSLRLNVGARYDHYSDFGGTFNPRLGFNWEFIKNYSFKFSYGSGFRAPSFGELTLMNNPALAGNPNLKPEKIGTYEAGIIAHPLPNLTTQFTYYHSDITQVISQVLVNKGGLATYEFKNYGDFLSQGAELEGRYDFTERFPGSYLSANYSYQNPLNQNGMVLPDVAHQLANVIGNFAYDDHWSGQLNLLMKSRASRAPGDLRPDVPGYVLMNMTLLSRKLIWDGVDLSFSIYNLLDKQYYDPAPQPMPIDYQQAGRSFYGHIVVRF